MHPPYTVAMHHPHHARPGGPPHEHHLREVRQQRNIKPGEAQLAVDVAEWLVCNAGMFDNMRHIDNADLVVSQL